MSVADLPDDGTADQFADQPYRARRPRRMTPAKLAFSFAINHAGNADFNHRVWRWWYLVGCTNSKTETTIDFSRL